MNLQIRDLFLKTEGRYLAEPEAALLLAYGDRVLEGLDRMQAIERAEAAILDDVVAAVLARFPEIPRAHGPTAEAKVRRDQLLVLRYAALSMLQHDPNLIHDKLAVWLRTIMCATCVVEQVLFGYEQLIAACQRHLTAEDSAALIPYIRIVLHELDQTRSKAA